MDESQAYRRVTVLLHEYLGVAVEELRPETHLYEDLGLDSIDTVEILERLYEEAGAGAEIAQVESEAIVSVGHLVRHLLGLREASLRVGGRA